MKFTLFEIEYAKASRKNITTKRKAKEAVSMLTITTLRKKVSMMIQKKMSKRVNERPRRKRNFSVY